MTYIIKNRLSKMGPRCEIRTKGGLRCEIRTDGGLRCEIRTKKNPHGRSQKRPREFGYIHKPNTVFFFS